MSLYPAYCFRGIKKQSHIDDDDTALAALYIPDNRTAADRTDKGTETSINWDDDAGVLDFTLQFRDENSALAYPHGVVRLPRTEIDHINTLESTKNSIAYERQKQPNNLYHGNIVFKVGLSRPRITMIAGILASASSKVIRS